MPTSGRDMRGPDYSPAAHYDRMLDPWRYLLGDELHYGVFSSGVEPLSVATNALTQRMMEASGLSAGMRVLDIGCGSGAPACQLARDHSVSVLGISNSRVSVATATARAEREGLGDAATFKERDGIDTGLPGASFDLVWALESSHLIRNKGRLINESARLLRPSGRLVLCDIVRRRDIPFREVRERRPDFLALRSAFGDAHMESLENYAGLIRSTGLMVVRIEDLTNATRPTFSRWRENARTHRAVLEDLMGHDGLATFNDACDVLEALWSDGTLGYGLITAVKSA